MVSLVQVVSHKNERKVKRFSVSSRRVHFAKSLTDKVPSCAALLPPSVCVSFLPSLHLS